MCWICTKRSTTLVIQPFASMKNWSRPRRTCGLPSQWSRDSQSGLITRMSGWAPLICFSSSNRFPAGAMSRMTDHRTKIDYAHCIQWLVDEVYPQAEYIRIVQDNLNTHTAAALYEAFSPAEARRILQRVEFHYTPKHGSPAQHGRDR